MISSVMGVLVSLAISATVMFFVIYWAVRLGLRHERVRAQHAQVVQQPAYAAPQQPYGPPPGYGTTQPAQPVHPVQPVQSPPPPYGPPPGHGG
ncbi:hypothetical protein [Microbispora sp. KK1-11]|uniref:hypothetical protein n=1 Tax=Microbispora sp. KK1-11 TaxID=2053005 RepID=UPI00115B882F|nr:hypothetical protein [Microbispora sp. KK1-11]TQS28893.1 hypothetical protein FLW16_10975 [Microbispora sp. KK1-11]